MKNRLIFALAGLLIGLSMPAFAQENGTPDPQIAEQLNALEQKFTEAMNNNDAAAVAALFTEDAVLVRPEGPIYGRRAIEKWYGELFRKWRFSDHSAKRDPYSPHLIGTDGKEVWSNGEFALTFQAENGPFITKQTGYWSSIIVREGDVWKDRMLTYNASH
jgi:uncharacterized protein (TIGR02246 family)